MYCKGYRKYEHCHVLDDRTRVVDIEYECGTILKIIFPEGKHEWFRACQGISSIKETKWRVDG